MPKKRFSSQYTKPQSTAHPSLRSPAAESSSTNSDAPPSVNELISSLRKSNISSTPSASAVNSTAPSHTLPPQIRQLLSQPETPVPRARGRRRLHDANGRRMPAGPAPPRSWLEGSRHAPPGLRTRLPERLFPGDLTHLPGLQAEDAANKGMRLQDMCLRAMAQNWEFIKGYERNNLADLPTRLRVLLLSIISLHGPEEGVGYEALHNLLITPTPDGATGHQADCAMIDPGERNENFHRLDLSGSIGRSISFKQLTELVEKPITSDKDDTSEFSWEESLTRSLSAPIPHLTHLSISHPPHTISWPRLISLTKHLPNLTYLSLAYWPVPSLTPNAKNTVVSSKYARDVQYGGTNHYSHSLDNDFREAADVLRRLAAKACNLEYLDLSGCTEWLRALRWTGEDAGDKGLEWGSQWVRMKTLRIYSGIDLTEASIFADVVRFIQGYKESLATEEMFTWWISKNAGAKRRKQWVEIEKDDYQVFDGLWRGGDSEEKRKRYALDSLQRKGLTDSEQWRAPIVYDVEDERDVAGTLTGDAAW
ncbi:hypothetical protein G7Y89_g901 [Cudoniella acicularis]|uniref:Tafazzin n=1 Tax=Cudoniella acicularis TaxID=354080 RepID=A0A8H4RXZ2_9HELO|nr:hypothetical protein G7Y89_g901 [Cudoniella acicularis]